MMALQSFANPIYIQYSNPAGHHVKPTKLSGSDYKTSPIQIEGVDFQIEDRYTQIQARNDVLADRNPSRPILDLPRLSLETPGPISTPVLRHIEKLIPSHRVFNKWK